MSDVYFARDLHLPGIDTVGMSEKWTCGGGMGRRGEGKGQEE